MQKDLNNLIVMLAVRFFTEKMLEKLVLRGLEKLAESTKNEVDNRIVSLVASALRQQRDGKSP